LGARRALITGSTLPEEKKLIYTPTYPLPNSFHNIDLVKGILLVADAEALERPALALP
jgi:hypothetical protein